MKKKRKKADANLKAQVENNNNNKYPDHEITGLIQWNKGGATDILTRQISEIAAQNLGQKIIFKNVGGLSGAYGTRYVNESDSDGYTLLLGSEHTAIHDRIGISKLNYENFKTIYLIGESPTGLFVNSDSNYNTIQELIDYARSNPKKLKCAITEPGGVAWGITALLKDVTGAEFDLKIYENGRKCAQAVISNDCDLAITYMQHSILYHRNGAIKYLTLFSLDPDPEIPELNPVATLNFINICLWEHFTEYL